VETTSPLELWEPRNSLHPGQTTIYCSHEHTEDRSIRPPLSAAGLPARRRRAHIDALIFAHTISLRPWSLAYLLRWWRQNCTASQHHHIWSSGDALGWLRHYIFKRRFRFSSRIDWIPHGVYHWTLVRNIHCNSQQLALFSFVHDIPSLTFLFECWMMRWDGT
jgi:hypothetical protein